MDWIVGEELRPVDGGLRRYSELETMEICKQVMQLIRAGILTPIRSPWSSGLVMIQKKGGSIRMCVDLRGVEH